MGPDLTGHNGARGTCGGGSEPWKKNLFSKRAGSGLQVLACGSGSGMKKPIAIPNLTTKNWDYNSVFKP